MPLETGNMTYYRESQKVIVAKEHNTASGRFAILLVAKGEEEKATSGEF